ncbi:MAG TPA: hypothetical protein DCL01_12510 [Thauera sp.]|nr:hypothetical protein [Thauera sp.]HHW64642.1 hypothetical protein [Rhodocyclaceae bacterium]
MTTPSPQHSSRQPAARAHAALAAQPGALAASDHPDPLLRWTALANETSEMMRAAAEVISHRTGRMAAAGPAPSADDLDEFSLMTQEKFEAAAESSWSVAAHCLSLNQQLWTQLLLQMQAGVSALMAAATSSNIAESMTHHAKLIAAMAPSPDAHAQLSNAAADLARVALEPIHARATANAERLGKRKATDADS